MPEQSDQRDTSVLQLSPEERAEQDVSHSDVQEAFVDAVNSDDIDAKDLRGVHLPPLSLDYQRLTPANTRPIDLRGAIIEGLSLEGAVFGVPLRLDSATIESLSLNEATLQFDINFSRAVVTGPVIAVGAVFGGDVTASGTEFGDEVVFDEAVFDGSVTFDDAVFNGPVTARAASFSGDSNLLDDNTSFTGATFAAETTFGQASFGFVDFKGVTAAARFDAVNSDVDGDAVFTAAEFSDDAVFAELTVDGDAAFDDIVFQGEAVFAGAAFNGGERARDPDATFARTEFTAPALFESAAFRDGVFSSAVFTGPATFTDVAFGGDADFTGATFDEEAVFEEARFSGDGNFEAVTFGDRVQFQGADFRGGADHVLADARFKNAEFMADATFHDMATRTANFSSVIFNGTIDFTDTSFTDSVEFAARETTSDSIVDLTRAKIAAGEFVQPETGWVHYDFTRASIGNLTLRGRGDETDTELLDYFRFCLTEFTEFDGYEFSFGEHLTCLEHTGFAIHEFREPPDTSFAVEMTPSVAATTYLKAKQAARANGESKIAGELRILRQRFTRRQSLLAARDSSASLRARVKNAGRAAENTFLAVTCGHGMRPLRIAGAFLVAPLVFVPLFAFGGPLFATSAGQLDSLAALLTEGGRATFFKLVHFSYISYTTIGYGNIGPQGALARLLAAGEAYLSVVLSALFVYALVKRSEL